MHDVREARVEVFVVDHLLPGPGGLHQLDLCEASFAYEARMGGGDAGAAVRLDVERLAAFKDLLRRVNGGKNVLLDTVLGK